MRSNIHAGIKYNRWVVDNFYNSKYYLAYQMMTRQFETRQEAKAKAAGRWAARLPAPSTSGSNAE